MDIVTAGKNDRTRGSLKLSPTARIANWSARHRWIVIAAAVLTIVLAMYVSSTFETKLLEGNAGGVGESLTAQELVDERFDSDSTASEDVREDTELLVFTHPTLTVEDPEFRSQVEQLTQDLRALPEVTSIVSYYDTGSSEMASAHGHAALARVEFVADPDFIGDNIDVALDVVRSARETGGEFQIAMTGNVNRQFQELSHDDFAQIMKITLFLGLGILLLAFRAVVAAVIPLILAIWAIFSATAAALLSQVYPLESAYSEMILLMGMAVGIDYSLFIVSRFRSERQAGRPKLDAIAVASNTTGRAVFYAGITVIVSLSGLVLTNNPIFIFIFISLSIASILVVLIALIGSLTLLPAILSALGDKVNWLRIPFLPTGNQGGGVWGAIADRVLAKPAIFATVTAAALIALAIPAASLNLGFNQGVSTLPDALEAKQAYVLLEENFTIGLSAPANIVVDAPDVNSPDVQNAVATLIQSVSQEDGYSAPFVTTINDAGDLLILTIPLTGSLEDEASQDAVNLLRDVIIPDAFAGTSAQAYVAGPTASSVDFVDSMYERAPYVFGFVLGLAFLLLLFMFRSIVIPIKAVILNLLSAGAAYGVLVMVFQWGWGISLLGSEATGIIMAWLPLFLFGILFGLSMDYHMLLLSRVKEAYDSGLSNEESVSRGIKVTAGQITSAAAIMVGVFGAFAMGSNIGLQQFGIGLGVAVLIDATVIRSVLLPASMKLLGDWNWYLPGWLEWLPQVSSGEAGTANPTGARPRPQAKPRLQVEPVAHLGSAPHGGSDRVSSLAKSTD